jgi:hypothetical protein
LGEGIGLLDLAVAGLSQGDDCHGYTPGANAALIHELQVRTRGMIPDEALAFLNKSPSMFLNLWMAATKCIMRAAEGVRGSSFVTGAAGNGYEVGIQVAGLPGRWFTAPATPPIGKLDDAPPERSLPAIGDSAVVEALGLGAMALPLSPVQTANLGPFMPGDFAQRRAAILLGTHPGLRGLDAPMGLSARAVAAQGKAPVIGLGILDRDGEKGRLGAGVFEMPLAPFADAVAALDST